jgi:CTP-dependent riboflavin kinase
MDTLLIQLTNQKAAKLIQDLEDLQIIKVLSKGSSQEKLSDKFRGSLNLTDQEYNDIQHQLTDMRNEWERNIK